ncbi:hypothetical protein JCM10212_004994 [Sporobolomyces blumeae]
MSLYGPTRSSLESEGSSASLDEDVLSNATSSASPRAFDLPEDSDDPSFSSRHFATSTPRKTRRDGQTGAPTGGGRGTRDGDDLRDSDTESIDLPDEDAIERGLERYEQGRHHARLTRTSLANHLSGADLVQPYSTSLTPRAISVPRDRFVRGDLYAPSPSTGSSTLVDRDEDGTAKAKAREAETTMRDRVRLVERTVKEEREPDDDQETVMAPASTRAEEDDEPSSSPRPHRRTKVGDLSHYLDAKLAASAPPSSTPHRSPRNRRVQVPQTPHAPGAFPSSARKPLDLGSYGEDTPTSGSQSSRTVQKTPPSSSSAAIHDAFARLITGPDGALSRSAERRAAMQSSSTPASRRDFERRVEPETPHLTGWHSFVPTTSLPVDTEVGAVDGEDVKPTRLETALRRAGRYAVEAPREHPSTVATQPVESEVENDSPQPSDFDEMHVAQRSAVEFAMARSFAHDVPTDEATSSDDALQPGPSRQPSTLRSSVRFAEPAPPRSRTPSPPRQFTQPFEQSLRQPSPRSRQPRSPPQGRSLSPDLPALPPLLAPASPEPTRSAAPTPSFRRSQSFTQRQSPLRERTSRPPTPPSPIRDTRHEDLRSPSPRRHDEPIDPPRSSTPPRRTVQPPNPDATPPRTSPSPLARGHRSTPPRSAEPTHEATESPTRTRAAEPRVEHDLVESVSAGDDSTLPDLVHQLAEAVRALAAAHTAPSSTVPPAAVSNRDSKPTPTTVDDRKFIGELAQRKHDRAVKRQVLENELRRLEATGQDDAHRRAEMLKELTATYEHEHDLGYKVEELKKSIHDMGQLVGDQVAQAVTNSLHTETRKRTQWLAIAFCFQLGIFWVLLRLVGAQSTRLSQTYYDPFDSHTFHLPFDLASSSSPDSTLPPETIALFTPYVSSHSSWTGLESTALILRSTVNNVGQVVADWLERSHSIRRGGRVVATSSGIPV